MSKSALTKEIECALARYSPAQLDGFEFNYRRGQYLEYEMPVVHSHIESGLVDAVWLAEGYNNHSSYSYCNAANRIQLVEHLTREVSCSLTEEELRSIGKDTFFPCLYADKCFWKRSRKSKDEAVAIICFEIKISKEDFKSPNGHNFVGNLNYYVMPVALYPNVADLIPEDIGCIVYYPSGRLVKKKPSFYTKDVDHNRYNSMLLTVLNKRCKQSTKLMDIAYDYVDELQQQAVSLSYELVQMERRNAKQPNCYNPVGNKFSSCFNETDACTDCVFTACRPAHHTKDIKGVKELNEHFSAILRQNKSE